MFPLVPKEGNSFQKVEILIETSVTLTLTSMIARSSSANSDIFSFDGIDC